MVINSIKVDKDNNKWFATNRGISKFDGSVWVNESKSTIATFPDYWVEDIEFLEDGEKIIATKNKNAKFRAFFQISENFFSQDTI